MRIRITIDRQPDGHWVVQVNGRDAIGFWGAAARAQAERQAIALEERLSSQPPTAARIDADLEGMPN